MTAEEIKTLRREHPKQLAAIYWSYIRKWRDDKLGKKGKIRGLTASSITVANSACQQFGCNRAVIAYDYCLHHFQKFVKTCYPDATAQEVHAFLATIAPRAFVKHAVIVDPVKPVTPSGAQTPTTPQSGDQASSDSSNGQQSDSTNKNKSKSKGRKKSYQFEQTQEQQAPAQKQVEELTEQVVDKLTDALGQINLRSITAYGPPVKPRKRRHKSRRSEECPQDKVQEFGRDALRSLVRDHGYERPAHVNWPGGGQSYFTPYVAAVEAERLLQKQAQVWAQDGMSEKDIKNRLQPYMEKVKKIKKKKKSQTLDSSPDKDPKLLTPLL